MSPKHPIPHDAARTGLALDPTQVGELLHDMANTLAVVTTNIDVALTGLAGDRCAAPLRAALERATAAVELRAAINQFVAAALATQATATRPRIASDIGAAVAAAAAMLRHSVEPGFAVETFADSRACVAADSGVLQGLIVAIATELRREFPEGGALRIVTGEADDRSKASISMAMRRSHLPEPASSSAAPRTGTSTDDALYTRLARAFLEAAGGTLDVEQKPGCCTVTAAIPLTRADEENAGPEATGLAVALGDGQSLLVVDYDEVRLEATHALLEGLGYAVHSASGGAEATAALLSGATYDALIVPFLLPEGTPGVTLADIGRAQNPRMGAVIWRTAAEAVSFRGKPADNVHMVSLPATRLHWSQMLCSALRARQDASDPQGSRFTSPANT